MDTVEWRQERKKEAMNDDGGGGGGPGLPKNSAAGGQSASDKKKELLRDQMGANEVTRYENQEYAQADDPDDVPLVMDDDEVEI